MNKILRMRNSIPALLTSAALAMVFAFLFATAPAPSAHAVTAQESAECANIRKFGTTVINNVKTDVVVMKTSFAVTYQAMLDRWKQEDKVNEASWQILTNGFTDGVDRQVEQATPERKKLLETYKTTVMDSLNKYKVMIDAARAQYREDMAALVRSHQAALEKLAASYITTLTDNMTNALADCSGKKGAPLKFLFTELSSGFKYIADVLHQDVTYIGKALKIIATFVTSIVQGVSTLINSVVGAIVTVLVGMLKTP